MKQILRSTICNRRPPAGAARSHAHAEASLRGHDAPTGVVLLFGLLAHLGPLGLLLVNLRELGIQVVDAQRLLDVRGLLVVRQILARRLAGGDLLLGVDQLLVFGGVEQVTIRLLLRDRRLVHLPLQARELLLHLAPQRHVDVRRLLQVCLGLVVVLQLQVHQASPVQRLDVARVVQQHLVEVSDRVGVRAAADFAQRDIEQQRPLVLLAEAVVAHVLARMVEVLALDDIEEVRPLSKVGLGAPDAARLKQRVAALLQCLPPLDLNVNLHVDALASALELALPELELDGALPQLRVNIGVLGQRIHRQVGEAVLASHRHMPQLAITRDLNRLVEALCQLAVAHLVLALPPLAHLGPRRALDAKVCRLDARILQCAVHRTH
mmetsp:Transcript_12591/g.39056  ORF Transcript_12591/g.39056 Transcript_12591/m.39056 type:complete len:380 (+) Transcript_12591:11-1150(+)